MNWAKTYSIETGVEFGGRLYKKDGKWKFEASGIGYKEDLGYFLTVKYYKRPDHQINPNHHQ